MNITLSDNNQLKDDDLRETIIGKTLMGYLPSNGFFPGGWWAQYYTEDHTLLDDHHGFIGRYIIKDNKLTTVISPEAETNPTDKEIPVEMKLYHTPEGIAFFMDGMKSSKDITHIANVIEDGDKRNITDAEKQKRIQKKYQEVGNTEHEYQCNPIHGDINRDHRAISTLMTRGIYHALYQEWEESAFHLKEAFNLSDEYALADYDLKIKTAYLASYVIGRIGDDLVKILKDKTKKREILGKYFKEAMIWSTTAKLLVYSKSDKKSMKEANTILQRIMANDYLDKKENESYEEKIKRNRNFMKITGNYSGLEEITLLRENIVNDIANADIGLAQENLGLDNEAIINIANDMAVRDYFRGLRIGGHWQRLVEEHSKYHYSDIPKAIGLKSMPLIVNKSEDAFIRFVINVNNDPVSAVVKLYNKDDFFIELDKASIHLGQVDISILYNKEGILNKQSLFDLWDSTFGCRIIKAIDSENNQLTEYTNSTLFEILKKQGVSNLKIIPHGFLYSLPLHAACYKENKKITYALEEFNMVFCPPWFSEIEESNLEEREDILYIADSNSKKSGLIFSQAEIDIIKNNTIYKKWKSLSDNGWESNNNSILSRLKRKYFPKKINRNRILKAISTYKDIHISSHAGGLLNDGGEISIFTKEKTVKIKPLDVVELNISGNIFLNCCHTSTSNPGTDINDYTMPTCFILAGAKSVISTVTKIYDPDAFRISLRINEYITDGLSRKDSYRKTMLECINKELPTFSKELNCFKYNNLSKSIEYFNKKSQSSVDSWVAYTFWERS